MKINRKGMTVVELLSSFIIISILVVGLLEIVFEYRTKATISSSKKELITYKESITMDIMKDVLRGVESASGCGTRCVEITFKYGPKKRIEVPVINTYELYKTKYISYGGRKYEITENIPSGVEDPKSFQNIIFGDTISFSQEIVGEDIIYKIDFSIRHIDLTEDYGLHLVFLKG